MGNQSSLVARGSLRLSGVFVYCAQQGQAKFIPILRVPYASLTTGLKILDT
jgi:hypothetical protein